MTTAAKPATPRFPYGLVDTDVHQGIVNQAAFQARMPEYWRKKSLPGGMTWPGGVGRSGMRTDARPPSGGAAGSDPAFLKEQLIDAYGIEYAILNGSGNLGANVHSNADFAVAYAQAFNDDLIDTWLSMSPNYRGSMMIAPQDVPRSVEEILRIGSHPQIVQVLMSSASPTLFGKRHFWPIYEAAASLGLPVAVHPGKEGNGITLPTASGYPSYYIEWHTILATSYINHLVSLICEGVFEKFPNFKFVLIEGGIAWAAPIMWRLDKNYKALRSEVPWLRELPSEYMKRHVRFTTQPIEEPANINHLLQIFEEIDAYNTVMFASDYPHWDFDDPNEVLRGIPEDLRRRIFRENALELYGLPDREMEGGDEIIQRAE